MSSTVVVKIGGSTLGSHDTTLQDVVRLQQQGMRPVVVHGGGPLITRWLEKQGVFPTFVQGLRVTDAASMEVVTAVLGGLVNKALVASLLGLGARAVGLSGVDGALLQGTILDESLGLVGRVEQVNADLLQELLGLGYVPVVAPMALYCGEAADRQGALLNVNGDTAAGEIAAALKAEHLVFLTDVEGVLDSSRRLVRRLLPQHAAHLLEAGIIQGGMVPKVQAALTALNTGTATRIVDGRKPGALLGAVEGAGEGTLVG